MFPGFLISTLGGILVIIGAVVLVMLVALIWDKIPVNQCPICMSYDCQRTTDSWVECQHCGADFLDRD